MRDWLPLLGHMPANKNGELWFERDNGDDRLAHDRQMIAKLHPNLEFALDFRLCKAVLRGTVILREENSGIPTPIKIKIIFPDDYPVNEPVAIDDEDQFPHHADRHFYKNGVCCLWLPLESQWRVDDQNTLLNYIDQVAIFFERQLIYDACGKWVWGERSHNEAGFIEFFEEHLGVDYETVTAFLPLFTRDAKIHKKSKCLCGSNRDYNLCHKRKVEEIKKVISKSLR